MTPEYYLESATRNAHAGNAQDALYSLTAMGAMISQGHPMPGRLQDRVNTIETALRTRAQEIWAIADQINHAKLASHMARAA